MKKNSTAFFVTASAIILIICGIGLVFAPDEVSKILFGGSSSSLPTSLWGGALCGFGAMNWIARRSLLGGIYGRAVNGALKEPDVRPMDFTGRPMKGMIYVSQDGIRTKALLARWVGKGVAYTESLPPK